MVELTNKEFFQDLDQTIAAQLFEQTTYPWEILPLIKDFVLEVGPTLSVDEYDQVEEDVWIAKSATIAKTATIFFLPVSIFSSPFLITTFVLSDFTFDVMGSDHCPIELDFK